MLVIYGLELLAKDTNVDDDDSGVGDLCPIDASQSQMAVLPLQAL